MYAQHEERQKGRVRAIKSQAGQSSTAERVKQVDPRGMAFHKTCVIVGSQMLLECFTTNVPSAFTCRKYNVLCCNRR